MLTLYTREGCFVCVTAENLLRDRGVQYRKVRIGIDMDPGTMLQKFPQYECGTCLDGIRLPIAVEGETLLGGMDELCDHLGGRFRKN